MATMYRLPRNAICAPCHEGAKAVISFLNKDEKQKDGGHGSVNSHRPSKLNSSNKVSDLQRLISDNHMWLLPYSQSGGES
ncbi:hypothetical protein C2845_PM03G22980 [Panicum miliaceum]|uniref:Uncharacterized protein n=1 Tax=Panicum miliaceum TaxID=4540 RepID=A0A3L6TBM9_PANMI|nr:hypothetical protein C2845_PM03G22980 [Panicum miliaceum]